MSWTFLKQQGLILSMLKNKFLSFLQFSEPCSWLVIFTFKCGISEFIDETERWHGSLRGDKFLQNMPKEQDCIVIANNKVIFHLEEKKNKNDNVRVHISILKLQYLSWSPFGKNSSMEGQNLYDGQCHISNVSWKNKGEHSIFLVYEDRQLGINLWGPRKALAFWSLSKGFKKSYTVGSGQVCSEGPKAPGFALDFLCR